MTTIYLVTIVDYESTAIMGAYSTEERARAVADGIGDDIYRYGRMGPFVVPLQVDLEQVTPTWPDGDPIDKP